MLKRIRELPSLDLLKGFEAAARNLSFTRAAAELFVTQSAISRQVQTLEDQLGVALFRRLHRELRLTEEGQTLYKTTGELLRVLRYVTGRLGARPAGIPGSTCVLPRRTRSRTSSAKASISQSATARRRRPAAARCASSASWFSRCARNRRSQVASSNPRRTSRITCFCTTMIRSGAIRGSAGTSGSS